MLINILSAGAAATVERCMSVYLCECVYLLIGGRTSSEHCYLDHWHMVRRLSVCLFSSSGSLLFSQSISHIVCVSTTNPTINKLTSQSVSNADAG